MIDDLRRINKQPPVIVRASELNQVPIQSETEIRPSTPIPYIDGTASPDERLRSPGALPGVQPSMGASMLTNAMARMREAPARLADSISHRGLSDIQSVTEQMQANHVEQRRSKRALQGRLDDLESKMAVAAPGEALGLLLTDLIHGYAPTPETVLQDGAKARTAVVLGTSAALSLHSLTTLVGAASPVAAFAGLAAWAVAQKGSYDLGHMAGAFFHHHADQWPDQFLKNEMNGRSAVTAFPTEKEFRSWVGEMNQRGNMFEALAVTSIYHHVDPTYVFRHEPFPQYESKVMPVSLLAAAGAVAARTAMPGPIAAMVESLLAHVAPTFMHAYHYHQYSHMPRTQVPGLWLALQAAGIMQPPESHAAHHEAPYKLNYDSSVDVASGTVMEALASKGMFDITEVIGYFVGQASQEKDSIPTSWRLKPSEIERVFGVDFAREAIGKLSTANQSKAAYLALLAAAGSRTALTSLASETINAAVGKGAKQDLLEAPVQSNPADPETTIRLGDAGAMTLAEVLIGLRRQIDQVEMSATDVGSIAQAFMKQDASEIELQRSEGRHQQVARDRMIEVKFQQNLIPAPHGLMWPSLTPPQLLGALRRIIADSGEPGGA